MKTKLLFLVLLAFFANYLNAAVWTVSNNANSPGQYTSISDAVADASSGDTILVVGSPVAYSGATINTKEVHIIGAGYYPNKAQNAYPTTIGTITLGATGSALNASNSSIEGCQVSVNMSGASTTNKLTNITVKRCRGSVFVGHDVSGVNIYNNIVSIRVSSSPSGNFSDVINTSNINISNNIIPGQWSVALVGVESAIFKNNILINTTGDLRTSDNTIFANNIFYGISTAYNNCNSYDNCVFNNNISYNSSNDDFCLSGTNSGSNNLVTVDPMFEEEDNFTFDYEDDFNLKSTSPGLNAGTDGTDIGIYGGSYPWPEGGISQSGFMYSQEAQIPQVNEMNIINSAIHQDGTLNVQVQGTINQ